MADLLEQDIKLFSDQVLLADGVMVFRKDSDEGKILFWLGDLPEKVVYVTERKNTIERISSYEILLGGKKVILIPSCNKFLIEKSVKQTPPEVLIEKQRQIIQKFWIGFPKEIEGWYECKYATFSPLPEADHPVEGNVVLVQPPTCSTKVTNATEIMGNIAIIERGEGPFYKKVENVIRCGAIAAICANTLDDQMIQMAAPQGLMSPIAAVSISKTVYTIIQRHLPGVRIKLVKPPMTPEQEAEMLENERQYLESKKAGNS